MNSEEFRFPDNPDWNGYYIVIHDERCQFTLLPLSLAGDDFSIRNTHLVNFQDFLTVFGPEYYVMAKDYLFHLPFLLTKDGISCVRPVRHRKPSENLGQLALLIGPCTQQQIIQLKRYATNNKGLLPPLLHWHEHHHQCDDNTPDIISDYNDEDEADDAILQQLAQELYPSTEQHSRRLVNNVYTYNPELRTVNSIHERQINTTIQHNNPYPPMRICQNPVPLLTTVMIAWKNQQTIQQNEARKFKKDENDPTINKYQCPLFPNTQFFNAVRNSSSLNMTCQRCLKHTHVITELEKKDDMSEKQFIFEKVWRYNHNNQQQDHSIINKSYQSSWLTTANQFSLLNDYLPGTIQFIGAPDEKYLIFHKSCHYRWDIIGVYIYSKEESYDTTPAFPNLNDFTNYNHFYTR